MLNCSILIEDTNTQNESVQDFSNTKIHLIFFAFYNSIKASSLKKAFNSLIEITQPILQKKFNTD